MKASCNIFIHDEGETSKRLLTSLTHSDADIAIPQEIFSVNEEDEEDKKVGPCPFIISIFNDLDGIERAANMLSLSGKRAGRKHAIIVNNTDTKAVEGRLASSEYFHNGKQYLKTNLSLY